MKGLKVLAILMALLMATSGITAAFAVSPKQPMSPKQPIPAQKQIQNTTNTNATNHFVVIYKNCTSNCTKNVMGNNNIKEIRNKIRKRFERAGGVTAVKMSYIKAKERYYRLKHEYMKLKKEGKMDFSHQKEFCMAAGILIDKWFDNIELTILRSNLNETIKNELLQKVEQEKMAFKNKMQMVNNSQTPEQLKMAIKQIRQQWREARLTITQVVLEVATLKLEKTANIAEKLEVKLQKLAGNSSNAQMLLEDYSTKIKTAKDILNSTENLLSGNATYENIITAKKNIMDAIKLMKEAFKDARAIVREVNMAGKEISRMNANNSKAMNFKVMGNGSFEYTGSGMVTVVASNAKITYTGKIVNVTGFSVNGTTLTGTGRVTLNGTSMSISVTGTNVNMIVRGTGTVKLSGSGVYWKRVGMQMMHENFSGTMEVTIGAGGES